MSTPVPSPGQPQGSSRRDFLKRATAAATVAGAASSLVGHAAGQGGVASSVSSGVAPYAGPVLGATHKIVCGFLGVSRQGYGARGHGQLQLGLHETSDSGGKG